MNKPASTSTVERIKVIVSLRYQLPKYMTFYRYNTDQRLGGEFRVCEKERPFGSPAYGAGKSTICNHLEDRLRELDRKVETLDGDALRKEVFQGLGYSKEERSLNVKTAAYLAKRLNRNGILVLASFISPYRKMREECRQSIPGFIEIYVKCPLEVCIRRDIKGLYEKALRGEIQHFTGISDPYEEPEQPEITLETDKMTAHECVDRILVYLIEHDYLL
jgi:adenylylsulfate kinase